MNENLNVFQGSDSIRDYLDPGKGAYLPLVELPASLNPFLADGVRISAKLMTFSGLHNVKAIPAYNMILARHERGELDGVTDLIENSSGNTVSSLAIAARLFGIENMHAIVPDEVSWNKLQMLLFYGIRPIVNQEPRQPEEDDPRSGVYKARAKGQEAGWLNPGQYNNPDNPAAHERWIGRQIWEQTAGNITVFAAGMGTTGTIIGNSKYLKSQNEAIQVVGVRRAPGNYVPGPRTADLLTLIGFDWQPHVDTLQDVTTVEAYQKSMELSRSGLIVGPSSGLSLVGLLHYLQQRQTDNTLDQIRNSVGEVNCTFICPDTPFPYFDEYFKYLDAANFPAIENEEFLLNKPQVAGG